MRIGITHGRDTAGDGKKFDFRCSNQTQGCSIDLAFGARMFAFYAVHNVYISTKCLDRGKRYLFPVPVSFPWRIDASAKEEKNNSVLRHEIPTESGLYCWRA